VQETITSSAAPAARPFWLRYDVLLVGSLLALLVGAVLTVDPVHDSFGLKGDEATYTAIAFSAAYDRDLVFERHDLQRYWALYTCGPDGIFLKRGKLARLKVSSSWPFVRFMRWGEAPLDRLYFGKAYIYPVLAAPFVWLLGLRGMLVFHLLLLVGVAALGYRFVAARSPRPAALGFTLAFLGASIVPVYGVWLTPEIFNFSLVFYAYFLWLYKEVAPPAAAGMAARFVRGRWSDLLAVVLLGCVTFSKPLYVPLVAPLLLWQLGRVIPEDGWMAGWRSRLLRAAGLSVLFALVVGALFSVNAAVSGEFNYQGSDFAGGPPNRKVFYGTFPHQNPSATFETVGFANTTSRLDTGDILDKVDLGVRFARNSVYFVVGRHSGLLPYFFPGLLALVLWWWRRQDIRAWHLLALGALVANVVLALIILPYTWNGGGGPPGNRYFMAIYPLMFFLLPPIRSALVPLLAWAGGALFVGQLVLNPYHTARFPHVNLDHGAVRALPVELTLVKDLPILLDRDRSNIGYGSDPRLTLHLLDKNAYPPEPAGLWIAGRRRADVVVRSTEKLSAMQLQLSTVVPNRVWVSFAGQSTRVELTPGQSTNVLVNGPEGVYSDGGYGYVLSLKPEEGVVPKNIDPGTADKRFLGVLVKMQGQVGGVK